MNTNSTNPNFSTQTEPIDLSNASTNTSYFNETTATQTQPLNFSTQTTNTHPLLLDPTLPKQQQVLSLQKKRIVNVNHLYNHFNPTLQDNFMRVGETQRLGCKGQKL